MKKSSVIPYITALLLALFLRGIFYYARSHSVDIAFLVGIFIWVLFSAIGFMDLYRKIDNLKKQIDLLKKNK